MYRDDRTPRAMSAVLLAALFGPVLVGPPAEAREKALSVVLSFVPTDREEVLEKRGVVPVGGPPFEILLVEDPRPEPRDLIGENRETSTRVPVWARTPVSSWISRALADTFRDWGTPNTPGAELALHTEIVKLFVIEEHTYQAEATMKFRLKRRDGTEIWAGIVGGAATRFGRSLKADNYSEVLSDAVFSCFSKLWVDAGFRDAWAASGKKPPVIQVSPTKVSSAETMKPEWARKRLLELREAGFDDEALAAWVKRVDFSRPFAAEDMLDLKEAGLPLSVIRAAMSGPGESLEPSAGTAKALALQGAGFGEDDLVAWVRRVQFTKPFSSTDMLQWKSAGVPQSVIRAAME